MNITQEELNEALCQSVIKSNLDMTKLLLSKGADANSDTLASTKSKISVLYYSIWGITLRCTSWYHSLLRDHKEPGESEHVFNKLKQDYKILALLIENGANKSQRIDGYPIDVYLKRDQEGYSERKEGKPVVDFLDKIISLIS
jgi:hypothetical protein